MDRPGGASIVFVLLLETLFFSSAHSTSSTRVVFAEGLSDAKFP